MKSEFTALAAELPVVFEPPAIAANTGAEVIFREIEIGLRSRIYLFLMRLVLKPITGMVMSGSDASIARNQIRVAAMRCPDTAGLSLNYQVIGGVPGHVLGDLNYTGRPVVLWLHGGAFLLPAAPGAHLVMVARICRDLGADGFVPDYRLAPFNRFPAGLDDCERAYRALLDQGYPASKIALGGDSAGGNLTLGLLQRIRKAGLPMPACAVPVSPATDLGRIHAPPSRHRLMKRDPILPLVALQRIDRYVGDWDSSDPEVSPLYMDCKGLPPMFFLGSDNEILMDETIMLARRMGEAGIPTTCHIWPLLPHAFPLFESSFSEVGQARRDIVEFMKTHLG